MLVGGILSWTVFILCCSNAFSVLPEFENRLPFRLTCRAMRCYFEKNGFKMRDIAMSLAELWLSRKV